MLAVLRQRNFALLWAGGLISMLGDWLLFIALPFYIYDLTGSALATGAMFIAETLPILLFGSIGGVFGSGRSTWWFSCNLRSGSSSTRPRVRSSPSWSTSSCSCRPTRSTRSASS